MLHNMFHKINYPEEYSTSNDISYQALGHLFSFEDIFLGTLDTYRKKMKSPSAVLGGGRGCKVMSEALSLILSTSSEHRLHNYNPHFPKIVIVHK